MQNKAGKTRLKAFLRATFQQKFMPLAIHTVIRHGNPSRFILIGGEVPDNHCALALIDGMKTDALLADKEYNANYIVEAAQNMGAIAVIPPKSFIKRVALLKDYSINLRSSVG